MGPERTGSDSNLQVKLEQNSPENQHEPPGEQGARRGEGLLHDAPLTRPDSPEPVRTPQLGPNFSAGSVLLDTLRTPKSGPDRSVRSRLLDLLRTPQYGPDSSTRSKLLDPVQTPQLGSNSSRLQLLSEPEHSRSSQKSGGSVPCHHFRPKPNRDRTQQLFNESGLLSSHEEQEGQKVPPPAPIGPNDRKLSQSAPLFIFL